MLGIFALNPQGMEGAIYQMLNHGISTGALFLLVGMIYLRRHTREISEFGGLWKSVPDLRRRVHGGDALVDRAARAQRVRRRVPDPARHLSQQIAGAAEIAVTGLILGALYMLYAYERVMFGPITKAVNRTIADLSAREIAVMAPLIALMLLMGLYPRPLLARMEPSVGALMGRVHAAQARIDRRQHEARALAALSESKAVAAK